MSTSLASYGDNRRPPARVERAVRGDLYQVQGNAILGAARTQATEFVAYNAVKAIDSLTDMETLAAARNPHGAHRYALIVDIATGRLAQIVAETGRP